MAEHVCENPECPHEEHDTSWFGGVLTIMIVGSMLFGVIVAIAVGSAVIAWFMYKPVKDNQHGWLKFFGGLSVLAAWGLSTMAAYTYLHPKEVDIWEVTTAANLREGPSTEMAVITVLDPGRVQHLAASGEWHKIRAANVEGYIHQSLLGHQTQKLMVPPKNHWAYLAVIATILAVFVVGFCWWYQPPIEWESTVPFDREKFNEKFQLAMTKLAAVRGYVDYQDMVEEDKATMDAKRQAKLARKISAAKLRKCDSCGASLSFKHGHLYCEYCGTQYK